MFSYDNYIACGRGYCSRVTRAANIQVHVTVLKGVTYMYVFAYLRTTI